jgi:hypothetical protein
MINRLAYIFFAFVLFSCGSTKPPQVSKPLFDILYQSDFGGAPFQFYEIITEKKEFEILLNDQIIKPYVKKEDIETCNFILVNLGEKEKMGFTIVVDEITELQNKIIISIKEVQPKGNGVGVSKPSSVIKIKSKKPIEIKD